MLVLKTSVLLQSRYLQTYRATAGRQKHFLDGVALFIELELNPITRSFRMGCRLVVKASLGLLFLAVMTMSFSVNRIIRRPAARIMSSSMSSSVEAGERAAKLGELLGISKTTRHIFLCSDQTKPKCCSKEAGLESWDFLKSRLKELKLVGPDSLVGRTKANCLQVLHIADY